jgi:hypothetical protein
MDPALVLPTTSWSLTATSRLPPQPQAGTPRTELLPGLSSQDKQPDRSGRCHLWGLVICDTGLSASHCTLSLVQHGCPHLLVAHPLVIPP